MTTAGSAAEVAENTLNFGFFAETLAVGSDGNVWIATRAVRTIAKYDVTAGVLTYYVSPYRDKPASIAAGVDGNLWIGTDFTYDDVDIFHLK
jgi:streptogramin lyase